MNDRIRELRRQSLEARPVISAERALLITEFYHSLAGPTDSAPVKRALALKHLLARKSLYLGPGELIVGERGPEP
ncbi:MAG: pyruvate formate lyase family protein, partial [Candidatus Aminicenantales bacterium]